MSTKGNNSKMIFLLKITLREFICSLLEQVTPLTVLLEMLQNKVIFKKAVSKEWCKQSSNNPNTLIFSIFFFFFLSRAVYNYMT